jgi:uncharacterized ferritin-like protein (DUF455 family)
MSTPSGDERPASLAEAGRRIVAAADPDAKVALALAAGEAWNDGRLPPGNVSSAVPMPDRSGRPARPELLPPRAMPKRSTDGLKGRVALLHSLTHIELNAIDLTWDLLGRFANAAMPRAFFDDWVRVGVEEARHYAMMSARLRELGSWYGELPAHDGLWQAAQATGHSLIARIAVVPLVLEARGLDVSPGLIERLAASGDQASAEAIGIIYRDEKGHVAAGAKWFRFLCERDGLPVEPTFHALVRRHFRGPIKPPFNDRARAEAGLTSGFYKPLVPVGRVV